MSVSFPPKTPWFPSYPEKPILNPKPLIMKCFIAAAVAALGLAGSTYALPAPDHPAPAYKEPAYAPASYSYNWAVKDDYSGNDFGQVWSLKLFFLPLLSNNYVTLLTWN